ncbi:hypothetical protein [Halovenus marina]|uniref:hypothetical protein n=1 Tax=Halovenus marina TaxID=3396621 RepID=UPI003F56538E
MGVKITIFEPHFEGAQIGPASIGGETDDEREQDGESDESGGSKSRFVMLLQGATVFVVMFVGLWVLLSRLLSEDDQSDS